MKVTFENWTKKRSDKSKQWNLGYFRYISGNIEEKRTGDYWKGYKEALKESND